MTLTNRASTLAKLFLSLVASELFLKQSLPKLFLRVAKLDYNFSTVKSTSLSCGQHSVVIRQGHIRDRESGAFIHDLSMMQRWIESRISLVWLSAALIPWLIDLTSSRPPQYTTLSLIVLQGTYHFCEARSQFLCHRELLIAFYALWLNCFSRSRKYRSCRRVIRNPSRWPWCRLFVDRLSLF